MFLHVKQSDCKAAVKVVSGIWLKVCVPSLFFPKKVKLISKQEKLCLYVVYVFSMVEKQIKKKA